MLSTLRLLPIQLVFEGIEWSSVIGSFFGLLIPGLITILGSFLIYQKRRQDRKKALRASLKTEIEQMDGLDTMSNELTNLSSPPPAKPIPSSKLPPSGVLSTEVYSANTHSLGILDSDVRDDLVEFYSGVINQKALIEGIRADDEVPDADHKGLFETIPELRDQRRQLLTKLDD